MAPAALPAVSAEQAEAETTVDEISAAAGNAGLTAVAEQNESPNSANEAVSPGNAEAIFLALRSGAWVDLYYRRAWLRAQLVWASNNGTLFMFVSHGGRAHSMTRRSCERLILESLLRPVSSQGVVAQALDAVVNEAARRSTPE